MALDHRAVPEEYTGYGWLDVGPPEDRERVERDWRDCVRTGKIFDDRYRVRTKAGSYRHYDVRAVPIERDGKIVEWVGASTDVTAQREAEEMRGPADRAAVGRGAAHRAAAAGHLDAGRGADGGAGGRGHHRGRPDRHRRADHSAVALLDGARLKVVNRRPSRRARTPPAGSITAAARRA